LRRQGERLRDALSPAIAEQLADIVGRIAANDTALDRVNRRLPDGAASLESAEAVARGVPGNFVAVRQLTRDLRLPASNFATSGAAYLWPAPERPRASLTSSARAEVHQRRDAGMR
jgi:hypothetical protein